MPPEGGGWQTFRYQLAYNFLTIFSDGFIAVWLLALLWLYWRESGFQAERG